MIDGVIGDALRMVFGDEAFDVAICGSFNVVVVADISVIVVEGCIFREVSRGFSLRRDR